MNFETMKMLLGEVGPARLTKDYDYALACDDMEQINLLLRKRVFQIVEGYGLRLYRVDINYLYNKFYMHLTNNPKLLPKLKNEFHKKVKRYKDYLSGYYTSVYGEYYNENGISDWYRLYNS